MYLNLAGRSERCAEVGRGGERKEREKKEKALIVSERSLARSECQERDKQHSSAASGINELTNPVRGA